jgi:ABC-type dipeptide/oligopeptide/nickel transport system permease subunit
VSTTEHDVGASPEPRSAFESVPTAASESALNSPLAIAEASEQEGARATSVRVSSPTRDAWNRFRRNKAAMVSAVIIIILVLAALYPPLFHAGNPTAENINNLDATISPRHWMGTDGLGQDLYSRIVWGTQVTLGIGFSGTFITVILGTLLGLMGAYYGGVVDGLLGRFTDLMFAFPSLLLAILVVDIYGPSFDSLLNGRGRAIIITVVFSFASWPGLARFVRALGLGLKEQQFVEAARTSGSSGWKIIRRHLLPNIYGLVLVQTSLLIVGIIYSEVVLAILDLGIPYPAPDLAEQLFIGSAPSVMSTYPHEVIFPALVLSVMLLAFSFIGDGLRDAYDPRGSA